MTRWLAGAGELRAGMEIWRHGFHRHPETGFAVERTAATVAGILEAVGCHEVVSGVGRTGVVGVIRGGRPGPTIGLRADLDALPIDEVGTPPHRSEVPGVFHGCGHDGHAAMLLGAAAALATRPVFAGTVVLVFQPDEENGGGALAMIDDGLFERFGIERIYGLHNLPGLPVGTISTRPGPLMSAEDLFEITIRGRGGHASTPELHVDPVVVAGELIGAIQSVVARAVPAGESAVVSITDLDTDGARNIVPSTVRIRGDCRSFTPGVRATIEASLRRLADGISAAHGATAEVSYRSEFVPVVNHPGATETALRAAVAAVGADRVDGDCRPIMASEDFARMLRVVPGCYVLIGNGATSPALHNPAYDFADDALTVGAAFWLALVDQECSGESPGQSTSSGKPGIFSLRPESSGA